jgi:hypothetical protein
MEAEVMSPAILTKLLQDGVEQEKPKRENLRYVIYVRKSTDEKDKQMHLLRTSFWSVRSMLIKTIFWY